jgi:hypothetical protein
MGFSGNFAEFHVAIRRRITASDGRVVETTVTSLSSPQPMLFSGNFGCAVTLSVAPPTRSAAFFMPPPAAPPVSVLSRHLPRHRLQSPEVQR